MSLLHPGEIERAKKNIKDYEQAKTFGNILNGTMALSGAGAAIGGFTNNKSLLYPSMASGFLSGFLKARINREEQHALNKMKGMYDIRRVERNFEKQAVAGGLVELASSLIGGALHLSHMAPSFSSLAHSFSDLLGSPIGGAALVTAADLATIPALANAGASSTRSHAYVAAKDTLGKALSPNEKSMRGFSTLARSEQMAANSMKPGLLKNTRKYFGGLLGPWGSGGEYGETAGKALKEVGKWSPKYRDLGLEAINSNAGVEHLKHTAIKDFNTLQEAGSILNSTIDEIPLARKFLNATGRSGEGLAKKIINNPESAIVMANDFKHTVQKTVAGGKSLAIATGLMGAGYMLGTIRRKHPLSENELPAKILN